MATLATKILFPDVLLVRYFNTFNISGKGNDLADNTLVFFFETNSNTLIAIAPCMHHQTYHDNLNFTRSVPTLHPSPLKPKPCCCRRPTT